MSNSRTSIMKVGSSIRISIRSGDICIDDWLDEEGALTILTDLLHEIRSIHGAVRLDTDLGEKIVFDTLIPDDRLIGCGGRINVEIKGNAVPFQKD